MKKASCGLLTNAYCQPRSDLKHLPRTSVTFSFYTSSAYSNPHDKLGSNWGPIRIIRAISMSSSCTNDGDKPRACVKPYDQIEAVEWRRDWKVLPAMLLATLVLLAWLAAAACVSQKHTILPLTHFKTAYHGLLGNGNYNTLVAVAGGVAGATVCFGISQAIKDLLRKEMLSLGGISLAKYTTLVKLANQAVDLRWHVTALFPLILFTTINLFGAATQAAFGVAVEYYNISTPFPLMRLSDNGDVMSLFLDATRANIGKVQILFSGMCSAYVVRH